MATKTKKKVIAIGSSDWHLHKFKAFDNKGSRLNWGIKIGKMIAEACLKYGVPHLFCGDLFHNPKDLENEVITQTKILFQEFEDKHIETFAIPGNHDMSQKNTLKNKSPHYLTGFDAIFKNFTLLELGKNSGVIHGLYNVYGLGYMEYQKEWVEMLRDFIPHKDPGLKNILLLHGNAPGAIMPNGTTIESSLPTNLDKFFKHWDLVLFGHIHKPMQLSKKCYMLGSPAQQNMGDESCLMGYWEIYDDLSLKFIALNDDVPEFLSLTPKEYDQYSLASPKSVQDYILLLDDVPSEEEMAPRVMEFNARKSKHKLAKSYCKQKGIKDKQKIMALTNILTA